MPIKRLFPRAASEGSFLGNMNMATQYAGRAVPSFDHVYMTSSGDVLHYFVDAIETKSPAGTTTGANPRQYAGANKTMWRLDNGVRTDDTSGLAGGNFGDVVQGMVLCDAAGASQIANDAPPAASVFSSGEACLLVGFGSSTSPRCAIRQLDTDTSPWTLHTTSTFAQFWLITKAGADLYAVTDAGVAVLGEWRVSKCPAGNDPTLAASWFNGLEVGGPEWPIVSLASIGDSVVVGKPDGLYYYNDQTKRFENVLPHLVHAPHALNGKGMKAVTNGVLYPTHDGKLYFFDGVAVQEVTPLKGKTIPRDVLNSRITAIADNGETVAVVTECWQNTTQNLGLTVVTRIAGTYADVTTSVTNGSLANGAAMATWGAAADDALFIGADVPIEAAVVRVTREPNAAVQSFTTPQYSNGTTGTTAAFDSSFTSFTAVVDGSILSTAATSLVLTGFPAGASNSVLTWSDIDAFKKMTRTEIQFGGSVGTLTKYWMRLKRTSSTGMTNPTTIDEVEFSPGRAGLPDEGLLTQATNYTNRDRAGGITHVWLGKRERTVGFVWHDVYALHTHGGVWAMAWHTGRYPDSNLGQGLVLWGRYKQAIINEGPTRDPARTLNPALASFSSSTLGPILNIVPEGTDLDDHTHRKKINAVLVDTKFADPITATDSDDFSLYMQWDEADIVHVGSWSGGPARIGVENMGEGRIARFWLAMQTASGTHRLPPPQIVSFDVDYDVVGNAFEFIPDRKIQLPEKT